MHDDRVARERAYYEEDLLKREGYSALLGYSRYYHVERMREIRTQFLRSAAHGRLVLELGSGRWFPFLDREGIIPSELVCINISKREIDRGRALLAKASLRPRFQLADAHRLPFPDSSFDVVFGGAILHHLELPRALDEIHRVLRPGGRIVFAEPLHINPAAKLVRVLTPKARTPDEHALRRADLRMISERFQTSYHYAQLLTVPAGVLSYLVCRRPDNLLNYLAFRADCTLLRLMPWLGPFYRLVLILGSKGELR